MKFLIVALMSLFFGGSIQANPQSQYWACSSVGIGVNPTFLVERFNGASSRLVRNTTEADPFVAIATQSASDRVVYEFPMGVRQKTGHISLDIRTLGIQSDQCNGKPAVFEFANPNGQQWRVPYCCRDI